VLAAFGSGKYPSRTGNNLRARSEFFHQWSNPGQRTRCNQSRLRTNDYSTDDSADFRPHRFSAQAHGSTNCDASAETPQAGESQKACAGRQEAGPRREETTRGGTMDHGVSHVVLSWLSRVALIQWHDRLLRHAGEQLLSVWDASLHAGTGHHRCGGGPFGLIPGMEPLRCLEPNLLRHAHRVLPCGGANRLDRRVNGEWGAWYSAPHLRLSSSIQSCSEMTKISSRRGSSRSSQAGWLPFHTCVRCKRGRRVLYIPNLEAGSRQHWLQEPGVGAVLVANMRGKV
jgi:hypothetical protein